MMFRALYLEIGIAETRASELSDAAERDTGLWRAMSASPLFMPLEQSGESTVEPPTMHVLGAWALTLL